MVCDWPLQVTQNLGYLYLGVTVENNMHLFTYVQFNIFGLKTLQFIAKNLKRMSGSSL